MVRPGPSDVPSSARQAPAATRKPTDFKSAHFLIHTDLKSKEAHALLDRLEVMLGLISRYWGQPAAGTIECYVVDDLAAWPDGALSPEGRAKIAENAGVTFVETATRNGKLLSAKALVFAKYGADPAAGGGAAADRGTPQHEAVHAYCGQAFGRTGPLWYAEGMAEMGRYWRQGDTSVNCDAIVVDYLRSSRPQSVLDLVRGDRDSLTGDSWQNYAWRWALCHLLENNPNYTSRFRALGLAMLNGAGERAPIRPFQDTFGAMLAEIDFEYRFFLAHLDRGYRVDLCSWDWNRKFREPGGGASVGSRVAANLGWQPSGVIVAAGKQYDYSAGGTWQLGKSAEPTTADGKTDGAGRLEGVVMHDFALSEPIPLSSYGTFTAVADGQLYLRCRDKWTELADNKGAVSVKIKLTGDGAKLARPGRTAEKPAKSK